MEKFNNTCHKIYMWLVIQNNDQESYMLSRHATNRWGVKKATRKKVTKLKLYNFFAVKTRIYTDGL